MYCYIYDIRTQLLVEKGELQEEACRDIEKKSKNQISPILQPIETTSRHFRTVYMCNYVSERICN